MYAYRPERGVLFELAGRGSADEQTQATAFEYQRDLLTRSIRYRASDEIPRDPGFCIDSGFIARSALNKEEVKMEATLPAASGRHRLVPVVCDRTTGRAVARPHVVDPAR
jgi:hypothetical protein